MKPPAVANELSALKQEKLSPHRKDIPVRALLLLPAGEVGKKYTRQARAWTCRAEGIDHRRLSLFFVCCRVRRTIVFVQSLLPLLPQHPKY